MNSLITKRNIYFIFILLLLACTNKNNTKGEIISIDSMIKSKYTYYLKMYDPENFNVFWKNINTLNDMVNKLLLQSNVTDYDIEKFLEQIEYTDKYNMENISILKETKNDKLIFNNNLLLFQYSLYSYYESEIYSSIYYIDMLKPLVIPNENKIKMGETYNCNIYLAAANSHIKPLAVINGDTLFCDSNYLLHYQITPLKRGTYKAIGEIRIPKFYSTTYYPFEINFIVE